MTQKEKLFREYATINNEAIKIFGSERPSNLHIIDIEKNITYRKHTEYSVQELKDNIEWIKRMKEHAIAEAKLKDFYNTKTGKDIKERLEYNKNHFESLIEDCWDDYKFELKKIITEICGDRFIVSSFGNTSFDIYYTDENGKELFGHDWSVYKSSLRDIPTINYPTLGSFDPMLDSNRVTYLEGLAKFAKPENFEKIVKWFDRFGKELSRYREEIRKIDSLLKNPYELAA